MVLSLQTKVQAYNEMKKYDGKRKHKSQMNSREVNGLWFRLRNVGKSCWILSDHATDRIKEKGIETNLEDIVSMIGNAELIEYKLHRWKSQMHERIVLRSKAIVNGDQNVHAVYDLTTNEVISVWMNHVDDRHATLDFSNYDKNTKVFGV